MDFSLFVPGTCLKLGIAFILWFGFTGHRQSFEGNWVTGKEAFAILILDSIRFICIIKLLRSPLSMLKLLLWLFYIINIITVFVIIIIVAVIRVNILIHNFHLNCIIFMITIITSNSIRSQTAVCISAGYDSVWKVYGKTTFTSGYLSLNLLQQLSCYFSRILSIKATFLLIFSVFWPNILSSIFTWLSC